LPEAQLEIREPSVGAISIPYGGVDLWIRLKPNGCTGEAPAGLLHRKPRADDLRCLFARPREHLRQRHDPALSRGDTSV
jgi:hypothetical protein